MESSTEDIITSEENSTEKLTEWCKNNKVTVFVISSLILLTIFTLVTGIEPPGGAVGPEIYKRSYK